MRRPGAVLTRDQLLEGAWDLAFETRSNVVDVYVRSLREKIDRPFDASRSRPCAASGIGCVPTRMSRLPIRLRLTLAFAVAMALVLTG